MKGDVRKKISEIEDKSVHLVVTSPPYWNIKDYGFENQIGFGQTYFDYKVNMSMIWQQCMRVLHSGCKLIINVGDQYLRAKDNNGKYCIVPIHSNFIKMGTDLGFTFLGNIIWNKISNTSTSGGCSWMGSIYYPRDGHITYEHEYILIFKKEGKAPKPSKENKELSRLTKEERSKWFRGVWGDVTPTRQKDHPAMFPLELPKRLIKMYSFVGETVLDPFVGSGTTMKAANMLGRNSIGIDLKDISI